MNYTDVRIISAKSDEIEINRRELALRLKTDMDFADKALSECSQKLMDVITYRCAYIRTDISINENNICDLGFAKIKSVNLAKNLNGCSEAFIIAATAGIGVDRLLSKLKIISQAQYYMTDAIASAAIESFMDHASDKLSVGLNCAPRFSPGYGDLPLSLQTPLLERLNAQSLLGITLDSSLLMTPMKSITAIMGIKK